MKSAIFLDRDGVIIENKAKYVRSIADVEFFDQALHALKTLSRKDITLILITNQSAVGRGIITLQTAHEINQFVLDTIRQTGGRMDHVYLCPHAPEDNCDCRKPKPGMLLKASDEHHIDLTQSILIGDAFTDIAAGKAANLKETILLLTGRGKTQSLLPEAAALQPFLVQPDLDQAVRHLIKNKSL